MRRAGTVAAIMFCAIACLACAAPAPPKTARPGAAKASGPKSAPVDAGAVVKAMEAKRQAQEPAEPKADPPQKEQKPGDVSTFPPGFKGPIPPPWSLSKVTRANYAKLEINMDAGAVEAILGPGKELSRFRDLMTAQWQSEDRRVTITVTFQGAVDDRVPTLLNKSIRD